MANFATVNHFVYGNKEKVNTLYNIIKELLDSDIHKSYKLLGKYGIKVRHHLFYSDIKNSFMGLTSYIVKLGKQNRDGSFTFTTLDKWFYQEMWDLLFGHIRGNEADVFHCWECSEKGAQVYILHNEGNITHYKDKNYINYITPVWEYSTKLLHHGREMRDYGRFIPKKEIIEELGIKSIQYYK